MKKVHKRTVLLLSLSFLCFTTWGIDVYLSKGLETYTKGDFSSSIIYFQKSIDASAGKNEDAQYWLTMALASSKKYDSALIEAKRFLALFPVSLKTPDMFYQKGRMECATGKYDVSISTLYDFIEQYPKNKAVSSAYFWIGEALYNTARFDEARTIFSVVILDYPESAKVEPAKYKLALIDQAATQTELLRLLKLSNDETIRLAKELEALKAEYSAKKQLKNSSIKNDADNERIHELENSLIEERQKNAELYDKITLLQIKNDELSTMIANFANATYLEEDADKTTTKPKPELQPEPTKPSSVLTEPVDIPSPTKTEETNDQSEADRKRRLALEELLRKAGVLQNMYDDVLDNEDK